MDPTKFMDVSQYMRPKDQVTDDTDSSSENSSPRGNYIYPGSSSSDSDSDDDVVAGRGEAGGGIMVGEGLSVRLGLPSGGDGVLVVERVKDTCRLRAVGSAEVAESFARKEGRFAAR